MISGLLVRSFDRLTAMNPGFDYQRVVTILPGLHARGYDGAAARQYLNALRDRLLAVPGVERASVVWLPPWGNVFNKVGNTHWNRVDADFVRTLGITLVRGRNFGPGDQGVALVSESFARRQWPGEDAVGKTLSNMDRAVVVGVVKTAGTFDIAEEDPMGVYYSLADSDYGNACLVVRVMGQPEKFAGILTAIARSQNPKLQPSSMSLGKVYDKTLHKNGLLATAVGLLGTLAALLAGIGLAGLTGYTVGQRTREIGVRMALGARGFQIVRSVIRPMVRPVAVGLAVGVFGAAAIASVLRNRIFGLRPLDSVGYLIAIGLFTAIVALASLAPVRRAIGICPADALRHE
jgi:ABC-type antimicrobial peptide transport system permease subunit